VIGLPDLCDHAVGEDVNVKVSTADRARRLHRVFGDVVPENIPDVRADHRDTEPDERDRWFRENRPPHHDTA
jgi:hypothetical protein